MLAAKKQQVLGDDDGGTTSCPLLHPRVPFFFFFRLRPETLSACRWRFRVSAPFSFLFPNIPKKKSHSARSKENRRPKEGKPFTFFFLDLPRVSDLPFPLGSPFFSFFIYALILLIYYSERKERESQRFRTLEKDPPEVKRDSGHEKWRRRREKDSSEQESI